MRFDAHQHFWRYRPETHPWISDAMPQLKRDFLPADLRPLLAAAGFDGCIAVQAQHSLAETEWLLQLADAHPFIRGVIGWVDLCAPNVLDDLQRLTCQPRLRGMRHIVQDEPDERFLLRPDFVRGIALLRQLGLTYDLLIYPRHLPAAVDLVRCLPDQSFVVDHIAKPEIRARRVDDWQRGIRALAAAPNVCCKLSGLVTEADWQRWQAADFAAYLDIVLEAFGPQRLMIGSDWPVCTLAACYADAIRVVTDYIGRLSVDEQDAVLGGVAACWYHLPPPVRS